MLIIQNSYKFYSVLKIFTEQFWSICLFWSFLVNNKNDWKFSIKNACHTVFIFHRKNKIFKNSKKKSLGNFKKDLSNYI